MVHWLWIPITLVVGVMAGFFLLALMEVSEDRNEKKKEKAWWDDG